jgi:peptide chain release factor 2
MSELSQQIADFKKQINSACERINYKNVSKEIDQLHLETEKPDFWNNKEESQNKVIKLANLRAQIKPWHKLKSEVDELIELDELNDNALSKEITNKFNELKQLYKEKEIELNFDGPFDNHDALINIYAGAGGTDAQDWSLMLLRMYTRWAEKNHAKFKLLEQNNGDEAGIKSATIQISLPYAYGKLKGEHGVHRLVRLSPFNADNLRQTSFAKVDVLPKIDKPQELQIDDRELKIDVFRAGGHGGQSVNTTDSAVRVTHLPTGINVSIQNERSQIQNKETALTILRSKLARLQLEQHNKEIGELKGPNQSAEWGNQIRSYVLHPYKQVKDLRSQYETSDPQKVLDGDIDELIKAYLNKNH